MADSNRIRDVKEEQGDPTEGVQAPQDLEPGYRAPAENEAMGVAGAFDNDLEGGIRGGAVGGEKGAVAAKMAGETVRGSIPDGPVEPNSPEAMMQADDF